MSADNYYALFKSKDGKFRAYSGSASCEKIRREPKHRCAFFVENNPEDLEKKVSQEYAEYGFHWVNYSQLAELKAKVEALEAVVDAGRKTIEENKNLSDGENCSLKELRDAIVRLDAVQDGKGAR